MSKVKTSILLIIIIISSAALFGQGEGRYELQSIEFEGNSQISSSQLSEVIYSEETPMWLWKFLNSISSSIGSEAVYFDSSNISTDLEAIKAYYNANGFFEATAAADYIVDTTDKEVNLKFTINEREASTYRNLNIAGIEGIPEDIHANVQSEMEVDTTEVYSQEVLRDKINTAVIVLQNSGYMLSRFDSTIIYKDTVENRADLNVILTTGKRFKIDTVYVETEGEGSRYVKEDLLREITDINPGEYYNLEKIRTSQVRLFRTGLFNSMTLNADQSDTTGSNVPLRLKGNIGKMNELSPEIIVNNQQSAFNVGLGATYIRKNFLGEARKFTLGLSFGVQDLFNADFSGLAHKFSLADTTLLGYIDLRATIEQPYLFNKLIFGIWENYATINKQSKFNNTIYGSKITFQFELPRFTLVNLFSTYYNVEVSKENYYTFNDSVSNKLISVIGFDIGRTTVTDVLFPITGYNISLQLEEANSLPYLISKVFNLVYNSALFYKIQLSNSFYFPLNDKGTSIFATKLKIGHLQAYIGDYYGLPLNRTFYAGGSNSVRGWRANELVPKEAPPVKGIVPLGVNVKGGTFLFEGSLEQRLRFLESFGVVFFGDYGNTWLGYKDFRFDEIALAAGLGLRYYSPIAPFRLDFGFKLYDPGDKKYIFEKQFWDTIEFHFGIGEAF